MIFKKQLFVVLTFFIERCHDTINLTLKNRNLRLNSLTLSILTNVGNFRMKTTEPFAFYV